MAEASEEPLPCKTLLLRVSIHCEGCKKKVKKVIQKVDGVYKVDIDSYQHKVTVTGNVNHDTLIKRLHKSGKQASIWPEAKKPGNQIPTTSNDKKDPKKESKDKEPKEAPNKIEEQPKPLKDKSIEKEKGKEKEKEKLKNEDEPKSKPPQEKEEKREKGKGKEKEKEKENDKPKENEKEKLKEPSKQEGTVNTNGKKKKEKKEEKESENENRGEKVEKEIGPAHPDQGFMYPYSYPYPPQPIMSYHTAQPSSSRAYYQQPPTHESYNMHPYPNPYQYQSPYPYGPLPEYPYGPPPEYSYGSTESSRRDDSLDYFNEENANSCLIM